MSFSYKVGDKVDFILLRETPGSPEGSICRGVVTRLGSQSDVTEVAAPEELYVIKNDMTGQEFVEPAQRIIRKVVY